MQEYFISAEFEFTDFFEENPFNSVKYRIEI